MATAVVFVNCSHSGVLSKVALPDCCVIHFIIFLRSNSAEISFFSANNLFISAWPSGDSPAFCSSCIRFTISV